ncbi:MAG: C1 family peptidase [Bacteroidota bacterium]
MNYTRPFFFLVPFLLLNAILIAQPQTKSILGIENAEMVDRLMLRVPGTSVTDNANLREQSIKPYMMPVRRAEGNHTNESYLLASCLEYYVNLNKNYKVNLSPDFIALNLQSQGKLVDFKSAFQLMAETGTVSAAIMPYGSPRLTAAVYATQKFKISNYLILFRSVTKPRQKIFELRKALVRGNPVIVELNVDEQFQNAYARNTVELSNQSKQQMAVLVVGFDQEKEAFEISSPYGTAWGKGGYIWVSYADLARQSTAAYVMVPEMKLY